MLFQSRSQLYQSVLGSFIVIICIFSLGALQAPQLKQLSNKAKLPQYLQKEVDSETVRLNLLKKLPSFGFNNLISDWVWLQFLQYFGDEVARPVTGYLLSPEYFEIILERDPKFLQPYLYLSTSTSLYAGMPERSVALIEKGLPFLSPQVPSKSFYVWRYKAIDELLFLGNSQAAKQSFAKAAEWASLYSDRESRMVGAISRQTAEFLANNPDSKSAQVSAWAMVLTNAVDERVRKEAINRIEALGGKVLLTPEGTIEKIQMPAQD